MLPPILRPTPIQASGVQPSQKEIADYNSTCNTSLAIYAALVIALGGAWVVGWTHQFANSIHLLPSVMASLVFVGSFVTALLALRFDPSPGWGISKKDQAQHLREQAALVLNKARLVRWAWRSFIVSVPLIAWMLIETFSP